MALPETLKTEIDSLVQNNDVMLFMKGNRRFPQCGFSATVIGILDGLLEDYDTVNILDRQDLREGIKEYSNWPTIPQLYIKGEFVGGCDIIREMDGSGELHKMLGIDVPQVEAPKITISAAAAKAFAEAASGDEGEFLRLRVSPRWQYELTIGPKGPGDFEVISAGVTLLVDRSSAARADGTSIDYLDQGLQGAGFKIENPSEPPKVRQLSVGELKSWMDEGRDFHLFDVRTEQERGIATIEGAIWLQGEGEAKLGELDKDAVIVFHCHHGARSQQAATQFLGQGFTKVYNLAGGIEFWSQNVDSSVKRY